jgi:hypothetical protein
MKRRKNGPLVVIRPKTLPRPLQGTRCSLSRLPRNFLIRCFPLLSCYPAHVFCIEAARIFINLVNILKLVGYFLIHTPYYFASDNIFKVGRYT